LISTLPIELRHVPQVIGLVRRTLAEFGIEFGRGSATDAQLVSLPGSYTDHGGAFFVAVGERDTVVGTCGLFPLGQGTYELRKMYLAPEARGAGLGRQLLLACLDFARDRGARSVVLNTIDAMKAAISLYERQGFVRDDTQIRAPRCTRGYRLDL
jgi:putative acetyltransferase